LNTKQQKQGTANVPDYAETAFQLLCDDFGVLRNKAHQDRGGWDYLVEFDRTAPLSASLDELPGSSTARIQVKSKSGGKPFTTLKLSNAARFTREPNFCFVILFVFGEDRRDYRIFARHFHRDLMEKTLRLVREAERDGKPALNRLIMRVSFSDEDEHTQDLMQWLHSICDTDPVTYAVEKQTLEERLGYGPDAIFGTAIFGNVTHADLVDHLIGLKHDIEVVRITLTKKRFGILSAAPFVDERPVSASFTVDSTDATLIIECESGNSVDIPGQIRKFGLPGIPGAKASFLSDSFKVVVAGNASVEIDFTLKYNNSYSLYLLNLISQITVSQEPATAYLQLPGKEAIEIGSLELQDNGNREWFAKLEYITTALCRCHPSDTRKFRLHSIMKNDVELIYFFAGTIGEEIGLEKMEHVSDVPRAAKLRYFVQAELEGLQFFHIIERDYKGATIDPNNNLFTARFGPPTILESGTAADNPERLQRRLRRRLQSIHKQANDPTISFCQGGLTPNSDGIMEANFTDNISSLEFRDNS